MTRHGYDVKAICDQFDARPAKVRKLLRAELEGHHGGELTDKMRAAGRPI